MKDLSLHILDIAQNSTRAIASLVEIIVDENTSSDLLTITIKDNGIGMDAEMVKKVVDPFVTSRTTRKVGLGIPLLLQNSRQSGGDLYLESEKGKGTILVVTFRISNIDTPPMGDLAGVITLLATGNPSVDFLFTYINLKNTYHFDTREVKEILGKTLITEPSVVKFLKIMLEENLHNIKIK